MKNLLFLVVCLTFVVLVACSQEDLPTTGQNFAEPGPNPGPDKGVTIGNGRGENYLLMDADLTGAVQLTATIPQDPSKEQKQLLKVTAVSKFEQVFTGKHQLFSYKITPTHIIAHVNIWEDNKHCSLVAIPKIQGKTPVLCLNRELVPCTNHDTNREYAGYDILGSEVFFSYHEMITKNTSNYLYCSTYSKKGDNYAAFSELRHWDGKSEKVTTLFRSEPDINVGTQLMVRGVYAAASNKNICIDTDNGGLDHLFCKKEGENRWNRVKDFRGYSNSTPFFKQGPKLLCDYSGQGYSLNLENFDISERSGYLPQYTEFTLENGGALGSGFLWFGHGTVLIDPKGNSEIVLKHDRPRIPARIGNWAWYISGEGYSLRRFKLSNGTLDEKDYFSSTTLLKLSSIFWTLGEFLRVDGTGTAGMPANSYLNEKGELAHVSFPPVVVEHPIELKWDQ